MKTRLREHGAALLLLQALIVTGCQQSPEAALNGSGNAAAEAIEDVAAPQGPERLVLAFGDSLYAGYGLQRGQGLPERLQAELRRDGINAKVVNASVSGDTTAAGRQRLAFALDNLPRKPDLVLLGLGGNDALRQIAPAETRANMTAMLEELEARGIPAALTGMVAPPNLGPDYAAAFNSIWPDLAKDYDAPLYPFILDGVIGNRALMLPDGIHPNAQGVEQIANKVASVVAERLKES